MEFNNNAKNYNEYAYVQKDLIEWAFDRVTKPSGNILELGAGTGFLTKKLSFFNCNINATDISENMIKIGKNLVPNVNWFVADAFNLNLNNKYDFIYSSSLLQWAENPINILNSWKKCLKLNAKIISFLYTKGTLADLASFSPFQWRTTSEWQNIFKKSGFKVEKSQSKCVYYTYKNKLDLLRYIQKIGVYEKNNISIVNLLKWVRHESNIKIEIPWNFYLIESTLIQ